MKSTGTSNRTALPLAEFKSVHVVFKVSMMNAWSLRQQVVDFVKNPVEVLMTPLESVYALKDINLTINAGDRIALLGRNGAGKTTLARCLSGGISPTRGKIVLNGKVRGVFDTSVGIFPELSGRENVRILIRFLYPQFKNEYANIENEIIEFSGLGGHIEAPFRTYSNGMQARLGLSLVSARSTDIVILDEVFDGADRFFQEKINQRIKQLINDAQAVVFVSHSMDQIRQVCNRGLVLEDGQIVFDGTIDKAIQHYMQLPSREQRIDLFDQ